MEKVRKSTREQKDGEIFLFKKKKNLKKKKKKTLFF
jgi:hypothetical protein